MHLLLRTTRRAPWCTHRLLLIAHPGQYIMAVPVTTALNGLWFTGNAVITITEDGNFHDK